MNGDYDIVELICIKMRYLRFRSMSGYYEWIGHRVTTFSPVVHNSQVISNVPV